MTHTDLKPCPMCGAAAKLCRIISPEGERRGDDPCFDVQCNECWVCGRWNTEAEAITAWNTRARTPDTAPSQSADLITEAEAAITPSDIYSDQIENADLIRDLITALRAAEDGNAELNVFRNGYKDTIRRLQDSVSAAEAREKVLREALKPFSHGEHELGGEFDHQSIWEHSAAVDLTVGHLRAARRALGGSND